MCSPHIQVRIPRVGILQIQNKETRRERTEKSDIPKKKKKSTQELPLLRFFLTTRRRALAVCHFPVHEAVCRGSSAADTEDSLCTSQCRLKRSQRLATRGHEQSDRPNTVWRTSIPALSVTTVIICTHRRSTADNFSRLCTRRRGLGSRMEDVRHQLPESL